MKDAWLDLCLETACTPAHFYSGNRKIIRGLQFTLKAKDIRPDLKMEDAGYTRMKLNSLVRSYLHEEARAAAVKLWDTRLTKKKYGSVGFHCFNHYIKGRDSDFLDKQDGLVKGTSKRASVMGPCIQSVSISLLNNQTTVVDLFYRTTELFKKFPADLVFVRDTLLKPFNFKDAPISEMTFHFANVTCHPMYFVTLLPMLDDPIQSLEDLRNNDKYFWQWIVKWTSRYVCDEYMNGIEKFAQAMRVRKDALLRLDKATLKDVQKYVRENHPGFARGKMKDIEGDDE